MNNGKILIESHNDGDGFACSLLMKLIYHFKKINNPGNVYDIVYMNVSINDLEKNIVDMEEKYGGEFDKLIVMDLPYKQGVMEKYFDTNRLIYRDHHMGCPIESDNHRIKVDTSKAACMIVLDDFLAMAESDTWVIKPNIVQLNQIKHIIGLFGSYDVFEFIERDEEYQKSVLKMQYMTSLYHYKIIDILFDRIIDGFPIYTDVENLYISQQEYKMDRCIDILFERCKKSFILGVDGKQNITVYDTYSDSLSLIPVYGYANHGVMKKLGGNVILRHFSLDNKKVTMVTDTRVDARIVDICKRYGGGGHATQKVGGYSSELLFDAFEQLRGFDDKELVEFIEYNKNKGVDNNA